jgi:putative lipoprotein
MQFFARRMMLFSLTSLLVATPLLFAQETASPPAKPESDMRRAIEWKRFDYTCDGDAELVVYLHNTTVKVRFKDKIYLMRQVPSADGGRYSDGSVQWWGRGNEGFLQEDAADGNGAMIVKGCKLDKPLNGESGTSVVTGTVSYLVRMALPPTAVIQVQLQDVSLADAPAKVIAEDKISLDDRPVPVPFSLSFDGTKIEQGHAYSVSAQIRVNGELRFISDKAYPVVTRGNPNHVDVIVKPVTPTATGKQ